MNKNFSFEMRSSLIFWSVFTTGFVQSFKGDNIFKKALRRGLEHSHSSWVASIGSINPDKEIEWRENSYDDLGWKLGLEVLEYCTDLDVHEKSDCMQFFFQTNLLFA